MPRPSLEERVAILDELGPMSSPVAVVDLDGIERLDLAVIKEALDARADEMRYVAPREPEPVAEQSSRRGGQLLLQ